MISTLSHQLRTHFLAQKKNWLKRISPTQGPLFSTSFHQHRAQWQKLTQALKTGFVRISEWNKEDFESSRNDLLTQAFFGAHSDLMIRSEGLFWGADVQWFFWRGRSYLQALELDDLRNSVRICEQMRFIWDAYVCVYKKRSGAAPKSRSLIELWRHLFR